MFRFLGGLLGLILVASCSRGEPRQYFDLVSGFGRAEVETLAAPVSTESDRPHGEGLPEWAGQVLADVASERLYLPTGARVAYVVETPSESRLRFGGVAPRGEDTWLLVRVETEAGALLVEEVRRPERDWELEVSGAEPALTRISLEVAGGFEGSGDGVLLSGPGLWSFAAPVPAQEEARIESDKQSTQPLVVIYLIDTLRRDRLGTYGYERPVSPNIDRFADSATVYERGIGQASWTKPSVASIFSGVWPPSHGATGWKHRLPDEFETLAERLRDTGYTTAAFVTNVNASSTFGLAQGFDEIWYDREARSMEVNEAVFDWLDDYDGSQPAFLYIHTVDPHAGYNPTEPFRSRFAPTADEMPSWKPRWKWPAAALPFLSDLYDGEIAQNDASFGALVGRLRVEGLFEEALIIVTADHGEEFREHYGWRHGRKLFAESLNVPLVVKYPGQRQGARETEPASHVDILPTVLDVLGESIPAGVDGHTLRKPTPAPVFSHLRLSRAPLQFSVVDGRWKLIQVHGDEVRERLFDVVADPGETKDLAEELPLRRELLAGLLRERRARTSAAASDEIALTDEINEALRALGYLD